MKKWMMCNKCHHYFIIIQTMFFLRGEFKKKFCMKETRWVIETISKGVSLYFFLLFLFFFFCFQNILFWAEASIWLSILVWKMCLNFFFFFYFYAYFQFFSLFPPSMLISFRSLFLFIYLFTYLLIHLSIYLLIYFHSFPHFRLFISYCSILIFHLSFSLFSSSFFSSIFFSYYRFSFIFFLLFYV